MNSLQLITKFKSKATDVFETAQQLFTNGHEITEIEKELIKKQAVELYELILKLKVVSDADSISSADNYAANNKPSVVNYRIYDINPMIIDEDKTAVNDFKDLTQIADIDEVSLNQLEEVLAVNDNTKKTETLNDLSGLDNTPPFTELENAVKITENIFEKVVEKAIENKRIQYTVMPPPEVIKTTDEHSAESMNERLAKINQNQSTEPRIDSLKTAISLNKKIAFVNELFKENVVEYAKAIDRLNNAENLNDAIAIMAEYRTQFNWEATNNLYAELDSMVKRRYKV